MTDKEVGKLWRKYYLWSGLNGWQAAKDIVDVIRKLVADNIQHLERLKFHGYYPESFNPKDTILGAFGIPSEEFNG